MRRSLLALFVALALISLIVAGSNGAVASAEDATPTGPVPETDQAGPPVVAPGQEIVGLRSETTSTYATSDPDKLETRLYAGPVHFQDDDGTWEKIDTTLVDQGDGTLATKATGVDLEVAKSANSDTLATITIDGDHSVGFGLEDASKGTASRSGDVETIKSALPHTDVQLDAMPGGVRFDVVLRDRAAPRSYRFPLNLKGLSADIDALTGGIEFKDAAGDVRARINPGYMDDSAKNPSGEGAHSEDVKYSIDQTDDGPVLVVDLDSTWIDDPARIFPIIVDPDMATSTDDTYVQSPFTNDYSTDTELKVGYCGPGPSCSNQSQAIIARSFLHFDMSTIAGRQVQSAALAVYETHSYSCDTSQVVNAYQVTGGTFPAVMNWGQQPTTGSLLGSKAFAHGNTCAAAVDYIPLSAGLVQNWASGTWVNRGIALIATNETTNAGWKKFASANQSGLGPVLTVTTAAAPPTAPSAPQNVTATADANGTVRANWSAPANNGGAAVDGYTVTLYPAGSTTAYGSQWCAGATCATKSWVNTPDNTSWYMKVSAHNSVGSGATATTNQITAYWLPGTPTAVSAWPGNGQAQINWTAASTNNGAAFDAYLLVANDQTTGATLFQSAAGTATTFVWPGLINGHAYTFGVVAHSHWGFGSWSSYTTAATPTMNATPYAPIYPSASPGNASVWVSWEKPVGNGSPSPFTYPTEYLVQAFDGATLVGSNTVAASATSHNTFKWTGLANGHSYAFAIWPKNSAGYYGAVGTNAVTPSATPPPFPPQNVTATASDSTALVTWSPPDSSGPAASTYTVYEVDLTAGTITSAAAPVSASLRLALTNGHEYLYMVVSNGANGTSYGAYSNNATPTALLASLLNPSNVHIDQRDDRKVHVVWTNALAALNYTARAYVSAGGAATGNAPTGSNGTTGVWVTGLRNGTPVHVRVTGDVLVLAGDPVQSDNVMTPAGPPFPAESLTATQHDGFATVTWAPPSVRNDGNPGTPGNNGAEISGYTVKAYYDPNPNDSDPTPSQLAATVPFTGNPLTGPFTQDVSAGLSYGVTYTYKVTATNAVGSTETTTGPTTTFAAHPGKVLGVHATTGELNQSTITWQPVSENGDHVGSYTVVAHPDSGADISKPASDSGFVFGDLAAGTGYTFTVVATNAFGTSAVSDPSNRIVPAGPPIMGGVGAAAGLREIYVHWDAADPNGGTLQNYIVTATPSGGTKTLPPTQLDTTFTGLDPATTYTFTVTAVSNLASTTSSPSNAAQPYDTATAPDAPTAVQASAGSRQASVSWTAATIHGANPTGYTVIASPGGATVHANGQETTADVTGLSNGTAYSFRVVANSAVGDSAQSAASNSVTPAAPASPGRPTITNVTTEAASATVYYRTPSGGGAPTSYTVTSSDGKTVTAQASEHAAVFTGFASPTYGVTFSVRANNDGGPGPDAQTVPINIGLPQGPAVEGLPGHGRVGIRWTESHEFDVPVDHYRIEEQSLAPCGDGSLWHPQGFSCFKKVADVPKGNPSTYNFQEDDFTNCVSFVVTAIASNGKEGLGTPLQVCEDTPNAPQNVHVSENGNGSGTLAWDPPLPGGTQAVSYTVYRFSSPDDPFSEPIQEGSPLTGTSIALTNQKPGVIYRYRIVAMDAAGHQSPYSQFANRTAPMPPEYWGVDSTDTIPGDVIAATRAKGQPEFWGRYIDGNYLIKDVHGETKALKDADIHRMLLFTGAYCTYTGATSGAAHAASAVAILNQLGVPNNDSKLINLDIEKCENSGIEFKVDSAFLTAWAAGIRAGHYVPGFYTGARKGQAVTDAVCNVGVTGVAMWYSDSAIHRSTPANAPDFSQLTKFSCSAPALVTVGWQYGITPFPNGTDALGSCGPKFCDDPNVDTDVVASDKVDLLWNF